MSNNKIRETKNNRKHDERFKKINIKHDPQAESARAVFHKRTEVDLDDIH